MTAPAKPNRRPEAKAVAATGAAGFSGGAAILFVLWLLGTQVWDAPSDAVHANAAIAAVPFPVNALVGAGVTALLTYAAAWLAPHTHRPDLANEIPSAAAADTIAEAAMRIDVATTHLDERIANQHEVDDMHHTGPIEPIPDNVGLRIMDQAHD